MARGLCSGAELDPTAHARACQPCSPRTPPTRRRPCRSEASHSVCPLSTRPRRLRRHRQGEGRHAPLQQRRRRGPGAVRAAPAPRLLARPPRARGCASPRLCTLTYIYHRHDCAHSSCRSTLQHTAPVQGSCKRTALLNRRACTSCADCLTERACVASAGAFPHVGVRRVQAGASQQACMRTPRYTSTGSRGAHS